MDDSDETYEPILPDDLVPPKPSTAPAPLPRMWKAPAEEDATEDQGSTRSNKARKVEEPAPKPKVSRPKPLFIKKKVEPVVDDGTGVSKLEETPVLDTFEARQRARWLIGGLLGAIGVVFIMIVFGAFRGGENQEIQEGEPPDLRTVSDTKSSGEVEARNLLDNARQADKLGKSQAALNLLVKLTKTYPGTAAAREALNAIDRQRVNKSLFGDDLPEQASGPTKPPGTTPTPNPTPTLVAVSPVKPPPAPNEAAPGPIKPTPDIPTTSALPTNPTAPPTIQVRALPSGYRPNYDAPIHASGWPTRIRSDRDGCELVLVPGGTFDMGRLDGEPQERPVHRVSLSTYYIDLHEVTVRQYATYLKATGRPLDVVRKQAGKAGDAAVSDEYPIVNISSQEAKSFCEWAHRTLPTEAQWEMAARSSEGRISYWNGELPRKDPAKGPRLMEPVMSLATDVSAFGAFDLGANAWEWTSEFYDSQYYQQFRNLAEDPTGPKKNKSGLVMITVKGGSKSGFLTWREGLRAETRAPYLGFRGALSVEGAPASPPGPVTPPPATGPGQPGAVQPF